jgi:hypothetical protein
VGIEAFLFYKPQLENAIWISKWQGRYNRGGGEVLRKILLEGIKNNY